MFGFHRLDSSLGNQKKEDVRDTRSVGSEAWRKARRRLLGTIKLQRTLGTTIDRQQQNNDDFDDDRQVYITTANRRLIQAHQKVKQVYTPSPSTHYYPPQQLTGAAFHRVFGAASH